MAITVVGLALIVSLGARLGISILGHDSLNVPRGVESAIDALAAVLLAAFVYLVVREIRKKAGER
jgi:hypothetical protein